MCTLSRVNTADSTSSESNSISGSDYSDFEDSIECEHNERVYEPVGEIRPSQFEPPGRTQHRARESEEEPRPPQ